MMCGYNTEAVFRLRQFLTKPNIRQGFQLCRAQPRHVVVLVVKIPHWRKNGYLQMLFIGVHGNALNTPYGILLILRSLCLCQC